MSGNWVDCLCPISHPTATNSLVGSITHIMNLNSRLNVRPR